jgi:hypothetical protein
MNDAAPQTKQQRLADLEALRRQLVEMAVRTKRAGRTEREQRQQLGGPVLVIRGK